METTAYYLPHDQLQTLISALQQAGYDCIGPQVRDGAIVYDHLENSDQLPWGVKEVQSPGKYRLEKAEADQAFNWVNGPQAIKPLLFKSKETLWKVARDEQGKLSFQELNEAVKPTAVFGVRPCDLAAMAIQDKVFLENEYVDERYKARREKLFVIVMNCTSSSANCFCTGAGGHTRAKANYDVAMTELNDGFVVEVGSDAGKKVIESLQLQDASADQLAEVEKRTDAAEKQQTKKLPQGNLQEVLFNNLDHARWEEVAKRCLSCTNCTQVCPTCFCHSEIDVPELDGSSSEHKRYWDSCFTEGHSYLHGNVVRDDTSKRYRQWLTHKLGSWFEQFGTSGCVGCGRCITWCPSGIDITEEAAAICGTEEKAE